LQLNFEKVKAKNEHNQLDKTFLNLHYYVSNILLNLMHAQHV